MAIVAAMRASPSHGAFAPLDSAFPAISRTQMTTERERGRGKAGREDCMYFEVFWEEDILGRKSNSRARFSINYDITDNALVRCLNIWDDSYVLRITSSFCVVAWLRITSNFAPLHFILFYV